MLVDIQVVLADWKKVEHCSTFFPALEHTIYPPDSTIIDSIITTDFIPAISDGILCSSTERRLIALPAKLGGLGIPIFSEIARDEFKNSCEISEDQKDAIILQESQIHRNKTKSKAVRSKIRAARIKKQTTELESIKQLTSEYQQRLIDLNCEKGASLWLSTLPIKEEGYVIAKNLFWDLIRLRYGWNLKRMPTRCECGSNFNIEHALSCKKGGFVSLRHNHLRNITCNLLNQICNDVSVEPMLHELTGEEFTEKSSIKTLVARLDVKARGFWQAGQLALFDIRVFNPMAKRYANHPQKVLRDQWSGKETKIQRAGDADWTRDLYSSRIFSDGRYGSRSIQSLQKSRRSNRRKEKYRIFNNNIVGAKKTLFFSSTISGYMHQR